MKLGSLKVFNEIYSESIWGKGSGSGSELEYCKPYLNFLKDFFYDYKIKSIVDLGCGDWQFSKEINFKGIKYFGIDVAEEVIAENTKSYSSEDITFNILDKYQDIPSCDLLICKDVMQHLSIKENKKIIKEVFPKFKYILSTNCVTARSPIGEFIYKLINKKNSKKINRDIQTGDCTLFNISKSPYNIEARKVLIFKGEKYKFIDLARKPSLLITGTLHKFVKETYLIVN